MSENILSLTPDLTKTPYRFYAVVDAESKVSNVLLQYLSTNVELPIVLFNDTVATGYYRILYNGGVILDGNYKQIGTWNILNGSAPKLHVVDTVLNSETWVPITPHGPDLYCVDSIFPGIITGTTSNANSLELHFYQQISVISSKNDLFVPYLASFNSEIISNCSDS